MNLYLQQLGVKDAPLLVFLHGGGVSGWMWEKQAMIVGYAAAWVADALRRKKGATEGVPVDYTGDAALKERLDGIIRWAPVEMAVGWVHRQAAPRAIDANRDEQAGWITGIAAETFSPSRDQCKFG